MKIKLLPRSRSTEADLYDHSVTRSAKELTPFEKVRAHWEMRAKRHGIAAVLSTRYSALTNHIADVRLRVATLKFLKGYIAHRKVFELGVGIVRMTKPLSEHAREVVGVDFSSGMIARAKRALLNSSNVTLLHGEITDFEFPHKSFDLVFESIVLLHILDPKRLRATAQVMQQLSDTIFIMEPLTTPSNQRGSKFSISRSREEYCELFAPYVPIKEKTVHYGKDELTMMLFKNTKA